MATLCLEDIDQDFFIPNVTQKKQLEKNDDECLECGYPKFLEEKECYVIEGKNAIG